MSVVIVDSTQRAGELVASMRAFREQPCAVSVVGAMESAATCAAEVDADLVMIVVGNGEPEEVDEMFTGISSAYPILVMMDEPSVDASVAYVRAGAEYVLSLHGDAAGLERSIAQVHERWTLERTESDYLVRMVRSTATSVTSNLYGGVALRDAHAAEFDELTKRYATLIRELLDSRAYQGPRNRESARRLASRLGELHATPRDLIELHTTVLGVELRSANPERMRGYTQQGRILILELMGYLASYYQTQTLAVRRPGAVGAASRKAQG